MQLRLNYSQLKGRWEEVVFKAPVSNSKGTHLIHFPTRKRPPMAPTAYNVSYSRQDAFAPGGP